MSGHGFGRGLLQNRNRQRSPRVMRPPAPGTSARACGKSKSFEMRQPLKTEALSGEEKCGLSSKAQQQQQTYASVAKTVAPLPCGDSSVQNPLKIEPPENHAPEEGEIHVVVERSPKYENAVSSKSPLFVVPNAPRASSWMEQSCMTDSEIIQSLEMERLRFPSFETLCSPGASTSAYRLSPTVDVFVSPQPVPQRPVKSPSVSSMSCDNTPSNCNSPSNLSDSHGSYDFCCEDPELENGQKMRERPPPFTYKRPKMRASLPASAHEGVAPCVNFRTTELMMERFANVAPFIDSHCHIDFLLDFTREHHWQNILDRHFHHRPRNFRGFIQVFCSHRRFRLDDPVLAMLRGRPDVWFSFGAHPKRLHDWSPRILQALRQCLTEVPNVVALGEVGLDYSGEFYRNAGLQKEALRQQLELAVELKLPIVLHCREGHASIEMDADQDLMDILREYVPRNHRMHLHCFTRDWQRGSRWLSTFPRLMIGLTPLVTQRGMQAFTAQEVIRNIPLDRVLIETDTPFFVPEEIDRRELTQSLPWFAITVAEQIATVRQMPLNVVLAFILSNTHRTYGLNKSHRFNGRTPSLDFNL